jgi:histidyl-tRNA synthetase
VAVKYRGPRGTRDILPEEVGLWRHLEETARAVFTRAGYGEMRTPIFEDTELFVRSTGEDTDIVEKEMYTLERADGASITLRPEGTPSIARAYVEHDLAKQAPFRKFFYVGPMFRYERPQAGRSRQFHQAGVEAFGSDSPLLDVETPSGSQATKSASTPSAAPGAEATFANCSAPGWRAGGASSARTVSGASSGTSSASSTARRKPAGRSS